MSGTVSGKSVIVTGAGRGIGAEMARDLARNGAKVCIADLNLEAAKKVAGEIGGSAIAVEVNVADRASTKALIAAAVSAFGRLDVMFNNAGVAGAFGPITDITEEDWNYTFDVLVKGVFFGMKHAARVLKAQGSGGVIVSTASIAGLSGGDGPQAYSASKAAVINLTRAVAVELAPQRIRVNAICPGGILTPLIHRGNAEAMRPVLEKFQPWPEAGQPEHIAGAALFLASDDATFVTGEALVVDGGALAAGSNAIQNLGGGAMASMGAGVDRGTTGQEGSFRSF